MYEDFSNKHLKGEDEELNEKVHVFQALQYLRKLCNHPSLVLSPQHPQYDQVCFQIFSHHVLITYISHVYSFHITYISHTHTHVLITYLNFTYVPPY